MRGGGYREYVGCIKIDDNVFVGANTTILANVHIGSNVIIGACSLVNKDLEGGFVYAGVPAKKISTFEDFVQKRKSVVRYPEGFIRNGDSINQEFAKWLWDDFYDSRYKEHRADFGENRLEQCHANKGKKL